MAVYRKQLKDKDGNIIYPDVGVNLDYSTTEHKTGGTWVDGKPIYKKTINFGTLPNSTAKTVATGITNLGKIVDLYGVATYTNGVVLGLPYLSASSLSQAITINMNGTNLTVTAGSDRSGATAYITILYTKTTD